MLNIETHTSGVFRNFAKGDTCVAVHELEKTSSKRADSPGLDESHRDVNWCEQHDNKLARTFRFFTRKYTFYSDFVGQTKKARRNWVIDSKVQFSAGYFCPTEICLSSTDLKQRNLTTKGIF